MPYGLFRKKEAELFNDEMYVGVSNQLHENLERHREQLTACQRQFRLANVKTMNALETQTSRELFKSSKVKDEIKDNFSQNI